MALGVHPAGKLLDYEQYIEHQIWRTRSRIKETDVLTAALTLATAALGILFVEVVLDHAIGMPVWLRRAIVWLGVSGGAVYAVSRIALPLFGRVNVFYAAKTIEDADPSFKNSLTTYLDLCRRRGQVSRAAFAAVEARAVKDLVKFEIDVVIDRRRLLRAAYALSGLVVLSCLYAATASRSTLDSVRRALLADVARPTHTRLVDVRPGDLRIVSGEDVPVSVVVHGTRPDLVTLHYSADGGETFSMASLASGSSKSPSWQATLHGVRQDLDYFLTAGDARSSRYHIKVMPAPSITSVRVDLIAPPYTGIAPRMNAEGGTVEAIEGTVVTVRARTNEPAASAHFDFDFGEGRGDRDSVIEVSAADAHLLLGRFTVRHSGTYTIRFKSTGGRVNPDPAVNEILAFPDRPPTVTFLHPAEPELAVPSNVKVPLVMKADDDYGVKEALLTVRQGNETLSSINLLEGRPPTERFTGTFTIDLTKASVSAGTAVEYWLSVRDTKEPIANRTESGRRIIRVAGPVPPEKRRAIEEQAEQEKAEAEKSGGMAEGTTLPGDENPRPDRGGRAVDVPREREEAAGAHPPSGNPGDDPPGTGDRPRLGPEQIARIEEILNAVQVRDGWQAPGTSSQPGTGATTHPGPAPGNDGGARHDRPPEPIASDVASADPVARAPTNPTAGPPLPSGAPWADSNPTPSVRANGPTRSGPGNGTNFGDDAPRNDNVEAVTPTSRDAAPSSDLRGGPPGASNSPRAPIGGTKPPQAPGSSDAPRPQPDVTKAGEPRPATRQASDPSASSGEAERRARGEQHGRQDGLPRPDQSGGDRNRSDATNATDRGDKISSVPPMGREKPAANNPDERGPVPKSGGAREGTAPASGTEERRVPDRVGDPKAGADARGQGESQRTGGPARRDGGEVRLAGPPGSDPVRNSDAKGTRSQERPGEVAGRARDEEHANRRPDRAGGKMPRGGQVDEDTRPDPSPGRSRSPQGAADPSGGDNARGKRPAMDDARRDPKEPEKPKAVDARRQVERPASKALTGETTRDKAKTPDEPKGPEKAKSKPPVVEKTTEKTTAPPRDPSRGLPQPPPEQAPASPRAPRSRDVPRRSESRQSGKSPEPREKQEQPPAAPGQPGETESGMPAGMPGPAPPEPSKVHVPHENSSSPGKNPSNTAPPRSRPPTSPPRSKPQDKSALPRPKRSRTSKPAPPRDKQSATPPRSSTSPRGSGRSSGLSGRGNGPGAGGKAGGSSLVGGSSAPRPGGAAAPGEPGESGRTTSPDPSGRPPDGGEPPAASRSAGSWDAPTRAPGAATASATSSRSSAGPGADNPGGVPPSPIGRSSRARNDPDGQPAEQSDGAGPPGLPLGRRGLDRGENRDASGGPPLKDDSRPTPPSPSSPEVSAADVAPRNQRQTQRVLRQLRDLIDKDQVPREVLAALGLRSNEELDQLVSRFEKAPQSHPGPGRTIESRPGDLPDSPPDLVAPAPGINATAGIQSLRHRGAFVDDAIRGSLEGPRFIPPPELRAGFDAYRVTVGRSATPNP